MKTKLCLALILLCSILQAANLEKDFKNPPPSARPWVYWFWLNGPGESDRTTCVPGPRRGGVTISAAR